MTRRTNRQLTQVDIDRLAGRVPAWRQDGQALDGQIKPLKIKPLAALRKQWQRRGAKRAAAIARNPAWLGLDLA